MILEEIKKDFPLLENRDIAYLDSGATTQKPKQVIEAIEKYYKNNNANPHRGAYSLSIEATEQYENTRTKIAEFINAKHREEIIFSKNATESLNLIAYSYGIEKLKKKITEKTKIVGITHISNVLGTINNIKKIIKYAHKKGAIVIVDASQSIPHIKIDVQDLNADFLVFSGHKMLAPLGIGVLYGKREILNNMTPFLMGGDMIEYVYEQETTFAPLPNKFEAGTQNVEGVIGLGAAIDYIQKIGYDKIQEKENEIIKYARQELSKLKYLKLYLTPNSQNHSSVISFNINGIHPHDVASILDSENVCVRSGNHCAQPLMRFLGIDSTCRASFYFYNTKEDVDKLVTALNKAYKMFEKFIKR